MKQVAKIILICVLVFPAFANAAYATSCVEQPFDKKIEDADLVFEGELLSVGKNWMASQKGSERFYFPMKEFNVHKVWKGDLSGKRIEIAFPLPVENITALPKPNQIGSPLQGIILAEKSLTSEGKPVYILSLCQEIIVPTDEVTQSLKEKFPASVSQ